MSKASEYAKLFKKQRPIKRLLFKLRCYNIAAVDTDGDLRIADEWLTPEEALSFAHWIIETFGDKESA